MIEFFSTLPLGLSTGITFILKNAGWIILPIFAWAIIPCFILKNRTAIIMVAYLSALEIVAWTGPFWMGEKGLLMMAHLIILSVLYISQFVWDALCGEFGEKILKLGTLMVIVDAVAYVLNMYPSFHLSIVAAIFIALCYNSNKGCRISLKIRKLEAEGSDTSAIEEMVKQAGGMSGAPQS